MKQSAEQRQTETLLKLITVTTDEKVLFKKSPSR